MPPGRTILCSEESDRLWALRQPPLDFGPQLEYHQPLGGQSLAEALAALHRPPAQTALPSDSFDLLVIDTVMSFLPAAQNNPGPLRKALNELRVIAGLRPASCCCTRVAQLARRPLAAFADILIDMQVPPGDPFTRRRHFSGVGRYPGTLQHVAAELNPEGTDYLLLPDGPPEAFAPSALETLRQISEPKPRAPDAPGNPRPLARERTAAAPRLALANPDPRLRAGPPRPHRGGQQGGGVSLWTGAGGSPPLDSQNAAVDDGGLQPRKTGCSVASDKLYANADPVRRQNVGAGR